MSVIFESTIKADDKGAWYIELKDTVTDKVATCKDLKEYEEKIQEFGEEYGHHIDEVRWLQEDGLPPFILDDVRMAMSEYQEKYQKEIEDAKKSTK